MNKKSENEVWIVYVTAEGNYAYWHSKRPVTDTKVLIRAGAKVVSECDSEEDAKSEIVWQLQHGGEK